MIISFSFGYVPDFRVSILRCNAVCLMLSGFIIA
jgi:hypothetical protein